MSNVYSNCTITIFLTYPYTFYDVTANGIACSHQLLAYTHHACTKVLHFFENCQATKVGPRLKIFLVHTNYCKQTIEASHFFRPHHFKRHFQEILQMNTPRSIFRSITPRGKHETIPVCAKRTTSNAKHPMHKRLSHNSTMPQCTLT